MKCSIVSSSKQALSCTIYCTKTEIKFKNSEYGIGVFVLGNHNCYLNLTGEIPPQSDFRPLIQRAASASFPIPVNPGPENHPRLLRAAAEHHTMGQTRSPFHLSLLLSVKRVT